MLEGSPSESCCWVLPWIGGLALAIYLYGNARAPCEMLWAVLFGSRQPLNERYGPWAVVTGSSDGIGKEYAKNLARRGMNLVLISRTESKLVQLAEEIRKECSVEVRWIAADFAEGQKVYDKIHRELATIELGMLVNNVGMLHEHPRTVDELPVEDLRNTISVNMLPTITLIHMLLPDMKRRRRGIIVNLTSASGFLPFPYINMYAASKAFLNNFTLGLQQELRGSGVECQLVFPMLVSTNLTLHWKDVNYWQHISANVEKFARMAVWTVGKLDFTTGYWMHGLQIAWLRNFPRWIVTVMAGAFIMYSEKRV